MKRQSCGQIALLLIGAMSMAGGVALAAGGVPVDARAPSGVIPITAGLPQWNIAEICATDRAGGQCSALESEALRALSGGWATLPEPFRTTCLGNLNSPYDKSYRLLSQCLEGQALKGQGKTIIGTAQTAGKLAQAAPAQTDVPAAAPPAAGAATAAAAGYAVLPTTSTVDLIKARESWGKGAEAKAGAAPPAAGTSSPAIASEAASGYAVLPTTSTADLIKAREAWGKGGDAKAVGSPLAAGAYSPLPKDDVTLPKGFDGQPTVHPLQASPPAQLTPVAPDQIAGALKALLAEREGWLKVTPAPQAGATPAAAPVATAASGYAILPTTSTADLFKAREAWGKGGEAKAIAAPLAAGARSPLPKNEFAPPKGFDGQPTVHPLQATPPPQLTAVPPDKIADAMKKLLAEREGWGTAPGKAGAKTAAAPAAAAAPKSAEAADCEAKLKAAAAKGVIQFKSSSADIDAKSNATLNALAAVAKSCSKGRIRVEGHTDSSGKAEANKVLSMRRAAAVAAYLVKAGVAKERIEAEGFGADKPVASNDTPEGKAKNRRIGFSVAD